MIVRFILRPHIKGGQLELGQYSRLMEELRFEDVAAFNNFTRVEPDMFADIVEHVSHIIWKQDRKVLEPGLKVALTLRHLATGDSYHSLMHGFRVPSNTICKFVPAIVAEYSTEIISCPTTPDEWRPIAEQFARRWNVHHAVGTLDGKHIAITCPKQAGSNYYNYKQFHSIILIALVDAEYKFSWVDVGSMGSAGDANVFNNSVS